MASIYAVIDTESEGFVGKEREGACAWCVGALLEHDAWRAENAHKAIPNAEQCAAHYAKGSFSVYWGGLDRVNKAHKQTFANFAVGYLARQRAAQGCPIEMTRTEGVWRLCRDGGVNSCVSAFDVANPAHVSEVLRVFFGPDVVACGIVLCAYDARERTMQVLSEDYAVYRPCAEHKASIVARAIHGLDAVALGQGRDIATLYERLLDIIEQHPAVVFVAHYAPHDRGVLLQSIENHVADAADEIQNKVRMLRLRRELQEARRWTCTWQRSVLLMPGVCGRSLKNFKLPTVYEAVTQTPLQAHHNARTDAYACAVILCRLLGCDDGAVRWRMLEAPV